MKNPDTKDEFQLKLSNWFEGLALDDQSIDLLELYESFESTERDVAEVILGKQETHGLPSWVSEETTKLKHKEMRLRRDSNSQSLLKPEQGGGTLTPD